jgi:pimeloyl-ACP methyl ester carboxylesterase
VHLDEAPERSDAPRAPAAPPDVLDLPVAPGTHLRVLDWGGSGPPVVLLHPNGFCGGLYEPVARGLRPHARPIAVDLRGHGGSSKPDDPSGYRFARLAADVVAALDQLGLRAVAGVGGSLGGAVAVLVDRIDPGRWTRLLLAEPVAFPAPPVVPAGENPMAAGARRRRRTFASREQMLEAYRRRDPLAQLAPEALEAYVRWGTHEDDAGVHLCCPPEIEATIFEVSSTPEGAADAWEHLPHLSCPATILAGRDTFLPDAFDAQAERAGARLETVPGGHFVLHEDTGRGVDLIRRHALG